MAISETQWDKARGYYEAGLSLSEIKDKTGIDRSTISKKAKIQQWQHGENIDYIEAKVLIDAKKSTKNQQLLNIADEVADDKIRRERLVYGNAEKLAKKLSSLTDEVDNAQDIRHLVEANDKLAITLKVADRHAPKSDINLLNAVQSNKESVTINIVEDKRDG